MSILKWVGGKRQLLSELDAHFPEECKRYYEPFGGSLTVTLHVYERYPNARIYVSDINPKLINLYTQLKKNPKKFIEVLDLTLQLNEDYTILREKFNTTQHKLEEAVLMFILNKKCFNGIYRVNKSGKFNVPEGKEFCGLEQSEGKFKNFFKISQGPKGSYIE
jgi:DNA adenine methylase